MGYVAHHALPYDSFLVALHRAPHCPTLPAFLYPSHRTPLMPRKPHPPRLAPTPAWTSADHDHDHDSDDDGPHHHDSHQPKKDCPKSKKDKHSLRCGRGVARGLGQGLGRRH